MVKGVNMLALGSTNVFTNPANKPSVITQIIIVSHVSNPPAMVAPAINVGYIPGFSNAYISGAPASLQDKGTQSFLTMPNAPVVPVGETIEFNVSFIGSVGAGTYTADCYIYGYEI